MHVDNSTCVHVNEVKDFMGHSMKPGTWLDVVIVVVSDIDTRGIHGKCPETVEVDLLADLQSSRHQHQTTAEPLCPDALHRPEPLHVEQVLWVEEEHASLGVKVIQHVLDSERHVSVTSVVEGRQHHGGVLVILQDVIKRPAPLLQLLKSAVKHTRKTRERGK